MSNTPESKQSTTEAPASGSGLPDNPNLLYALMALLVAGIGVGIYLVYTKLQLDTGLIQHSSCDFGGSFNCDKVAVSDESKLFGLPVGLYSFPTYGVMLYLSWLALKALSTDDAQVRKEGSLALTAVAGIGLLTVLDAAYLAYVSSVKIGAYCVFCMSLYAINIAVTVLAIKAGPKTVGQTVQGGLQALAAMKPPIPMSLVVVVLLGGVAWIGYDTAQTKMNAMAVQREIDGLKGEEVAGAAQPAAAQPGATAPAQAAPVQQAEAGAPRQPGDCFTPKTPDMQAAKVSGKKTEDGWTEFITPLDDDCEFFHGPKDAKVTVVKYADFQCGYCRYLALTMDPVMKNEKYKDNVRFVMKNFPMNVKCNPRMAGYDKHPVACEASSAARCAGLQGKFWEYHDHLYANQDSINLENLEKWAADMKLDMPKFKACMVAPETAQALRQEIQIAFRAGIYGTPRTYINGRLVTGSASKSIIEYHIDRALKEAENPGAGAQPAAVAMAPKTDGTTMIEVQNGDKSFWIDAFEGSLTQNGKAAQVPGAVPARVSWLDAKNACEKSGKRLCTEQEWVTACAGKPAVDDNNNGMFGDDTVEGNMYPYGAFYQVGKCHDQGDKYTGKAIGTGTKEECRTPSGIFDLGGNIAEWVGDDKDKVTLMGGHASSTERAACNDRAYSPGIGRRNQTTGFRCCADSNVKTPKVAQSQLQEVIETYKFRPPPAFTAETTDGKQITEKTFKGKVTLVNFFASWCGPCKKEFPYLVKHAETYGKQGLQMIGVGVDNDPQSSIDFAKGYNINYPMITDPDSVLMGRFMVYSMPATFIIDKQGVVQYATTGFKPEEDAANLEAAIKRLL